MKRAIYLIITLILNIVAIILLREHIVISELSSLSVIFMAMMGFFSWQFKLVRDGEMPMNAGTTELNEQEMSRLAEVLRVISFGAIPFFVPFIFFFSDKIKALVPSVILCSFVIVGILLFRAIYGKKIKARLEAEERERQLQEKRERGDL